MHMARLGTVGMTDCVTHSLAGPPASGRGPAQRCWEPGEPGRGTPLFTPRWGGSQHHLGHPWGSAVTGEEGAAIPGGL